MATQAQIDQFLRAILGFESGGNATAQNPSASASGLFGYIDSTWDNFGGYRHAREAPAEVQWQKARLDVTNKLRAYGGDWRKVAMAWYLPAAVNNPRLQNVVPAPEAGNTKTPAQYADMVISRFTGQRTGGAQAMSTPTTTAPKPVTEAQLLDYIRKTYPDVYGLLFVDREVRGVLLNAARNGWDEARLRGALSATKWWKTTAATAREWDSAYATDKATGDALLTQTRGEIASTAARLGITLTPAETAKYALNVRRLGWTQQMVMEGLAAKFTAASGPGQGMATVQALKAVADEYGVSYTEGALYDWTRKIIAGKKDEAGFRADVVNKAKSLYPTIAAEIDADTSTRAYFDPYVQIAAQNLGLNPEDINLSDTKWRRALVQVDPATGKRVPMTLDQWEAEVKTNTIYGYDRTTQGREAAAQLATQLRRAVGFA